MGCRALPSSPVGWVQGSRQLELPTSRGADCTDQTRAPAWHWEAEAPGLALPSTHCVILLSSPASLLHSATWTLSSQCPLHPRDRLGLKSEGTYSNSSEEKMSTMCHLWIKCGRPGKLRPQRIVLPPQSQTKKKHQKSELSFPKGKSRQSP